MRFEKAWVKLEGEIPLDTDRSDVLDALVRGIESSGLAAKVVKRRTAGAPGVMVTVETDNETERRTGYGMSYRVVDVDGSPLLEKPRDGFCFGFKGKAFAKRLELDVQLKLRDGQRREDSYAASARHFIAQNWKDPGDRKVGNAALKALERSLGEGNPTEKDIEPVVAAARSSHKGVFDVGGTALALLAERFVVAREALSDMVSSKDWKHRLVAISYARPSFPRPFLIELLRRGLQDASERIVQKAAERCADAGLTELEADMTTAEGAARDKTTREWVSLMKDLARQGYAVRPKGRGEYELVVKGSRGTSYQDIEKKDLAPARLKRLVEEARSD